MVTSMPTIYFVLRIEVGAEDAHVMGFGNSKKTFSVAIPSVPHLEVARGGAGDEVCAVGGENASSDHRLVADVRSNQRTGADVPEADLFVVPGGGEEC